MSLPFQSRRSPVYSAKGGIVSSSQPLATQVGIDILNKGGNAADAAVAVAACLNVVEPTSTGIGGDVFAIFFDPSKPKEERVRGLNASGRCPLKLSLEKLKELGIEGSLPKHSPHCITVPGAALGWVQCVEQFGSGRLSLEDILGPAISIAEEGFPVSPITAHFWKQSEQLLQESLNGHELLVDGKRAPNAGEIMKNSGLARTFRMLAKEGARAFYEGAIAEAIVSAVTSLGGVLSLEDLKSHRVSMDKPISVNYRGVEIWEMPPNGQGLTALMALNMLEQFDVSSLEHNGSEHLHVLIECLRLAFADTRWYCADPAAVPVPTAQLISKPYAKRRLHSAAIHPTSGHASPDVLRGSPTSSSDTVYFSVVDSSGAACSFINSNYMGFGTGIVPKDFGFTLQNRGANFSLARDHPNRLEPGKRPYHTIIPGMATKDGELYACFGVMGGFMQPQGHVQVMSNLIDFGFDPQAALDAPRICIADGSANGVVYLEEGMPATTLEKLAKRKHNLHEELVSGQNRALFGRGQVILQNKNEIGRVYIAGSDPRADGCASAQILI